MNVKELTAILKQYPKGDEVVVIGRREPLIAMTVEQTAELKEGWYPVNEGKISQIRDKKRIVFHFSKGG